MKKIILLTLLSMALILLVGCKNSDGDYTFNEDTLTETETVESGTGSVTDGDNFVDFDDIKDKEESTADSTTEADSEEGTATTEKEWTNIY